MLELFDIIENYINQIIVPLNWLMLVLIIGGGIYLTFISRANPLIKINQGFRLLLKKDNSAVGISRFQALSAVLAATVGLGNISGVSIAIHQGGPGVLVWMWVTALIGATIKFFSCSLAVSLRGKDENGDYLGGPMYYMTLGIKKWGKPLAIWFSIAGLVGVLPAFTANQLTQSYIDVVNPNEMFDLGNSSWKLIIGVIFTILTSVVIFGGLKSIVRVTSGLVPIMVILYFILGLFILVTNANVVPSTFLLIFSEAFNFNMVNIEPGSELIFLRNENELATVLDHKKIKHRDSETSLSAAALLILNEMGSSRTTVAGPRFWTYEGETLSDLRNRIERS